MNGHVSMPSGRSAAKVPGARANAMTDFHGRPLNFGPSASGNALTNAGGAAPAVAPAVNRLTGVPIAAMQAEPAPVQPAPTPSVSPGQERTVMVGKIVGADKMSDADLTRLVKRFTYMHGPLGDLATKPDLAHGDAMDALTKAVRDGEVPAAEAKTILGGITTDPAKLRQEMADRRYFTTAALVHLVTEQQRRGKSK